MANAPVLNRTIKRSQMHFLLEGQNHNRNASSINVGFKISATWLGKLRHSLLLKRVRQKVDHIFAFSGRFRELYCEKVLPNINMRQKE